MSINWFEKDNKRKTKLSAFLRKGYKCRSEPLYFDEEFVQNKGLVHRPLVYPFAAYLAERFGSSWLVDFGCGKAYNLALLSDKFRTLGIDCGENIYYCRNKYKLGKWIEWNFENEEIIPVSSKTARKAVVVCSELIEHLMNPIPLINNIKHILSYSPVAVMTTPNRNIVPSCNDSSPLVNPHHVRGWNLEEFQTLLTHFNIGIEFLGLTVDNNFDMEKKQSLEYFHEMRMSKKRPLHPIFKL